ncbi:undecaprenyl-diphosphate phosphatase [Patulibacter defluvii]|uniref:undecaprenyl-diphosphate phosphatase n=1 Tax=Patulibacter defluvii TaxID=3095358 RepID=UPI002A7655D9|nr:undecaprenyl-diphosphate phosphatase [Patulibacter sp. DM4]
MPDQRSAAPPPGGSRISRRRALVAAQLAGLLHGPAEALPVSSSAHVALVARLAAGRRGRRPADPEVAKSVEVGAHAGTLLGLAVGLRHEAADALRWVRREPRAAAAAAGRIAVASLPAVAAALTLERPIERHLGGDRAIASGLLVGGLAMTLADRRGAGDDDARDWRDATVVDAAAIGLAQATALWPGVSRSGAVLAAARARGFSRASAGHVSAALAVPVVGGATALKVVRLGARVRQGTIAPASLTPLAAVTATAAVSGRVAAPIARRTLDGLPLAPFAAYRVVLAGVLLWTDRRWTAVRERAV